MDKLKIEKVSVALSPIERKIVSREAKKHGVNFSASLRMIVRDWEANQAHWIGNVPTPAQPSEATQS